MPHPSAVEPVPEPLSHGRRPPLHALTSIRFFAAIYVVFFHTPLRSMLPGQLLRNFLASGYTGVTLFFALSGFILAYNYPHVRSRRAFWIARFARIYPVYIVAVFAALVLQLANPITRHTPQLPQIIFANIFLVQAWWGPWAMVLNSVGWTLSVEAFLYAVFPFAIGLCHRAKRWQIALLAAVYLLWVLPAVVLVHTMDTTRMAAFTESTIPLIRLATFLFGMLAGVRFSRGQQAPRWLLPLSITAALCLLCWAPPYYAVSLRTMCLTYAYVGLIYSLATVEWPPLTNRWLLLGGEISYSIYLLQVVVLRIFSGIFNRLTHNRYASISEILGVPLLIVVCYFSFRCIELPARNWIRSALRPRPPPAK